MTLVLDKDIKFGFEYETLIELNILTSETGKEYVEITKTLNKLMNQVQDSNASTTVYCNYGETYQRAIRFMLARFLNKDQNKPERYFRPTPAYGKEPCGNPPGEDNKAKTWIIENDISVQLLQKKSVLPVYYLYKSIDKWTTNLSNDYIGSEKKQDLTILEYIEFVSPVFNCSNDDFNMINNIYTEQFEKFSLLNNSTTSNHIHFSIKDYFRNPEHLTHICIMWLNFESLFMRFCPWWRRKNIYCKPMREVLKESAENKTLGVKINALELNTIIGDLFHKGIRYPALKLLLDKRDNDTEWTRLIRVINFFQGDPNDRSNRYTALNLLNLVENGIGTIEVRTKHGSDDKEELINFIKLYSWFFKTCINSALNGSYFSDLINHQDNIYLRSKLWTLYDTSDLDGTDAVLSTLFDIFYHYSDKESSTFTELSMLHQYFLKQLQKSNLNRNELIKELNKSRKEQKKPDLSTLKLNVEPMDYNSRVNIDYDNDVIMEGGNGLEGNKKKSKEKKFLIFSYGSNSAEQLAERTGATNLIPYPAYIDNWVRIFAGSSNFRKGGVASIYPCKGSKVYGSVFELTEKQLNSLDKYEPGYKRIVKNVHLKNNMTKCVRSFVYIREDYKWLVPPSLSYMQAIRKMLDDVNKSRKKTKININGVVYDEKKKQKVIMKFGYFLNNEIKLQTHPSVINESNSNQSKEPVTKKRKTEKKNS